MWDFAIQTDSKIKSNRPNIVVKDYKSKTCPLINMTAPTDSIISKTIMKYLNTNYWK